LQNGLFENGYAELVRAALATAVVMPDGMKSAVIRLLNIRRLLWKTDGKGDFLADIQELTDVAIQELRLLFVQRASCSPLWTFLDEHPKTACTPL
jgi:hypothetical protein